MYTSASAMTEGKYYLVCSRQGSSRHIQQHCKTI